MLECQLETGRTHQIRVHLAAIGHPVVGDGTYGGGRTGVDRAAPVPARRRAVVPATRRPATPMHVRRRPLPADLAATSLDARSDATRVGVELTGEPDGRVERIERRSAIDARMRSGHGAAPWATSATGASVKPSSSWRMCSPASFQIASSTHWPSWSHDAVLVRLAEVAERDRPVDRGEDLAAAGSPPAGGRARSRRRRRAWSAPARRPSARAGSARGTAAGCAVRSAMSRTLIGPGSSGVQRQRQQRPTRVVTLARHSHDAPSYGQAACRDCLGRSRDRRRGVSVGNRPDHGGGL